MRVGLTGHRRRMGSRIKELVVDGILGKFNPSFVRAHRSLLRTWGIDGGK